MRGSTVQGTGELLVEEDVYTLAPESHTVQFILCPEDEPERDLLVYVDEASIVSTIRNRTFKLPTT